jgi:hypothetical protein
LLKSPTKLLLLAVLISLPSGETLGQNAVKVTRPEPIPTHYKTWSLFLVCNPRWLASDRNHDLKDLHDAFYHFGDTIGSDNAAVWFWKKPYNPNDQSTFVDNLDVPRSSKFCEAFHLPPSLGPYLFVTSTYPDESNLPDGLPQNSAYFALGNLQSPQISDLLAHLADKLVQGGGIPTNPGPDANQTNGTWVHLLVAAQQTLKSFGCALTFKVDAEGLAAEFHPCKS